MSAAGDRLQLLRRRPRRCASPHADIEAADYQCGDLPSGQSAITARVQILLDRSGISPGVVDGWRGGMSERHQGLSAPVPVCPADGRMSPVVWQLLQPFAAEPLTMTYTITDEDSYGLVDNIPSDYGEKAKMTSQGYTSIEEKLAERFHMDEKFLVRLNPGIAFVPGATIQATVPAKPIRGKVARIIIDKATRRVAAHDDRGRMVADYPATVGSDQTPSPHGTHTVDAVALDPVYTYNPNRNFKQGNNDRVLTIPPGPNGPVGNVWIDLSQPTYGIHGTATPSKLFVSQSNGCVRLTNWDARELAGMVQSGKTVVEFLAPGQPSQM
ncbi:L,D-transpeptidase [Paracoccus sp. DMF-8]|uniref:L,D-transpeptidase n=1 Tax=Paracoccus sp. DMF-8 TaxID=3019445 RepID=UPI0023E7CB88|nr:L,D-transpeptidase [Paracoccus sp. DMF-8]MDF3606865.1 L,D-transpeptidase [Paracoccus sp. DMF-8]